MSKATSVAAHRAVCVVGYQYYPFPMRPLVPDNGIATTGHENEPASPIGAWIRISKTPSKNKQSINSPSLKRYFQCGYAPA